MTEMTCSRNQIEGIYTFHIPSRYTASSSVYRLWEMVAAFDLFSSRHSDGREVITALTFSKAQRKAEGLRFRSDIIKPLNRSGRLDLGARMEAASVGRFCACGHSFISLKPK